MLSLFLSGLYLFLFILSWYILLVVGFNFLKVLTLKNGRVEVHKWTSTVVGLAISYIIMALVIGL